MKKFYKLTEPLYSNTDRLEVALRYRKGVGYEIVVTPIAVHYYNESNPDESSFYTTVEFNSEYSSFNVTKLVSACKKRTVKALDKAFAAFTEYERQIVDDYLDLVRTKTNRTIAVDESATPTYGFSKINSIS